MGETTGTDAESGLSLVERARPDNHHIYLSIAAYGFVTCLLLNDFVKVLLAKELDVSL